MPEPTAPASAAAPAPVQATSPEPSAAPTPSVDLESIQFELKKLRSENGRLRNEVGVFRRHAQEVDLLRSTTDPADPGEVTSTAPPYAAGGYASPTPVYPPGGNFVSKDEFDEWRFDQAHSGKADFLKKIREVAYSSSAVPFIKYQVDPYGRPLVDSYGRAVPDRFRTFEAIAQHLELEELRKQRAQPLSNPAFGVISGVGASAMEPSIDLASLTPEQIREKFPEAFPAQSQANTFWTAK